MATSDHRAAPPDRRRPARTLTRCCRRGGAVLVRAAADFYRNGGFGWAGAVAYYGLLSLVPLLLVAGTVASAFVDPERAAERLTAALAGFLPPGGRPLDPLVRHAFARNRRLGLGSLLVLLWTGRQVIGALRRGLNLVSDVDETDEHPLRQLLVEAVLLVAVGGMVGVALTADALWKQLWEALGVEPARHRTLVRVVPAVGYAGLVFGIYALVYGLVPRGARGRAAVLVGAATATGLFLAARSLVLAHAQRLALHYAQVYGALAPALLLLVWGWLVAVLTLFAGSLASHVKVMVLEGRSATEAARRHVSRPTGPATDAP
jgi:YihY family inner membrane protein